MEICVFQGGSYAINVLIQARATTHAMTEIMLTAAEQMRVNGGGRS